MISEEVINSLKTKKDLISYLDSHKEDNPMYQSALDTYEYKQKYAPWKVIKANRKTSARIAAFEYILKSIPCEVNDINAIRHKTFRSILNE